MSNIDDILAKLNPKTQASFRKASTLETEKLLTPSLGINVTIGGGLRFGQIHTLWGNRSSGKTLFCLGLVREAQKIGKTVAWIDAEKNFDQDWAALNGVDPDDMIISQVASIADMADGVTDLIKNGIDLVVVDSMSVLLPQSFFEDGEMKDLAKTGQIGTFAKNYAAALNMINNLNEKTCVVMISQLRNKINTWGASKELMGGEAAEFINSTIIKFWSPAAHKEDIMGKIHKGDLILTRPIGRPVTWTIDKSRGPGMHQSNAYNLYFAGDFVGIDKLSEIVNFGIEYGIITKSGNWLGYGEIPSTNGKDKFIEALRERPEVAEALEAELLATA